MSSKASSPICLCILIFVFSCKPSPPLKIRELRWETSVAHCQVSYRVENSGNVDIAGRIHLRLYTKTNLGRGGAQALDRIADKYVEHRFQPGMSEVLKEDVQTVGNLNCAHVDAWIVP